MKPTPILIQALRKTAQDVLNPEKYCWASSCSCNCGLLAQNLLGIDKRIQFRDLLMELRYFSSMNRATSVGPWSGVDKEFCSISGLPTSEIAKILSKYGLEKGDFFLLEFAGTDPNDKSGLYICPKYVSQFMLDLANKLENQLKAIVVVDMAEKPVSV